MVTIKRRLSLVLGLVIGLYILIFAARAIAAQQPSALAEIFTNPDGSPCEMPCMFGVRPGVTTFERALTIFHEHPLTRNLKPPTLTTGYSESHALVFVGASGGVILYSDTQSNPVVETMLICFSLDAVREYTITLGQEDIPISPSFDRVIQAAKLGDVLGYLGSPSEWSIDLYRHPRIFSLRYPKYSMGISSFDTRLGETIAYWESSNPYDFTLVDPLLEGNSWRPWRGLTQLGRESNVTNP